MTVPRRVAILLFEGVEVLDACGPFEVFTCAEDDEDRALFEVAMVARTADPVTASGGLVIVPRYGFEDLPQPDIALVPGGMGTRREQSNAETLDWIRARDAETELTLSVCTGAHLLGAAGLLDGLTAATYWRSYDELRRIAPDAATAEGRRWVDNGRIVTSSGVSAGIDMALYVVGRLHGSDTAERTARNMEYDWRPEAHDAA